MQSNPNSLLNLIPIKEGYVYLIYGLRGVGKSIFILNIFDEFLNENIPTLLDIPLTKNHLKKIYTFFGEKKAEALLHSKILFSDIFNITKVRLDRLKKLFLESFNEKKSSSVILIDDIIPPFLAIDTAENKPRQKTAKEIMLILSYITLLSRAGKIVFISIREDLANLAPYMSNLFSTTVLDVLIRIRRKRRIREIFLFSRENEPFSTSFNINKAKFVKIGEFVINEKAQMLLSGRFSA
ncbi:MAG: hypothetical protein ACP6IP_05440 [Candidatus Njordarchaeia archaeon]